MSGLTYIYTLRDPRNGEVRYVGKSINPRKRLQGHIADARSSRTKGYCGNWIKDLLRHGVRPELTLLQAAGRLAWPSAEQWWIAHYRDLGARLTNLAAGGEGPSGRIMPQSEKEMRKQVNWWKTATVKQREQHRKNVISSGTSEQLIAYIRRYGAWNRGTTNPGAGRNLAQYIAENGPWNKGRRETRSEVIEKLRLSHLGKKQSPETIAKRMAAITATRLAKRILK